MAYLNDNTMDFGLDWIDDSATRLDICSQAPTTYGQATTDGTYSLGYKTGIVCSAPADHTSGRKVTISEITDGTVTDTNTATHWAITNGVDTLIAWGTLAAPQAVTDGNTFTLAAFIISIPDPA